MLRSNDADLLSGERQPGAIDAVTSVIAPWQTLSALATETGQAVRQKLTHSGAGAGKGHVQQGVQQDPTALADGRPWPDESTTLSHSAQVSAAQRKAKSVETSGHIDQEAIQANISQVQRKMVSTDAATEVVLRFNFMSARESKAALLGVLVSIVLGAGVLVTEFVHKMKNTTGRTYNWDDYNIAVPTFAWDAAVGSTCLVLVTISLGFLLWRVLDAIRLKKNWKHRQRRNVVLITLEATVQWINLICYVVPNVFVAVDTCYTLTAIPYWFAFARWTCWNTIFTLFLIHAYSSRVWKQQDDEEDNSNIGTAAIEHGFQSPKGHSKLVMDGPLRLLWPCLLLWPCMQAIASYEFITSAIGEGWDLLAGCNKWTNATPEQWVLAELAQAPTPEAEPPQPILPGVNYVIPGSEPEVQGWVPYIRVAADCSVEHQDVILWYSMTACAILYLVLTYLLLWFKLKSYRQRAYTSVQVGLVYNTLQLWLRMAVMSFWILCLVLLALVGINWCASQNFAWAGLMPMQIVMTANTVVLCYIASPKSPKEHFAASAVWLQEFAWTEEDKPVKLQARSAMVPDNPKLAKQPLFCFETMMNLLYWSCFVYDHMREQEKARKSQDKLRKSSRQMLGTASRDTMSRDSSEALSKAPSGGLGRAPSGNILSSQDMSAGLSPRGSGSVDLGSPRQADSKLSGTSFSPQTSLTLSTALSLYNMTESYYFWETEQDTRCLVGWGGNTVVVSFRGTASTRNALADVQAWRMAHPPERGNYLLGTKPLVHVGFLKSWLAGGLDVKVVSHVVKVVQQCKEQSQSSQPVTVYVTGHSLGGALATLAAFDIRKQLTADSLGDTKVVCYTFAAPRTGNHAFAREFNSAVPDTWSVINDQDIVTRGGKMVFLYKRPGQRVILNDFGHMMVRPTHMECSVQKTTAGQRATHHFLKNYYHAILCVILAQFSGRGFVDGMEGIIKLAQASPYVKDLLEVQMGMSLPEMEAFCHMDPATRQGQCLPGLRKPIRGFYILKNPPAPTPSTTTTSDGSSTGRRWSSFWVRPSGTSSLQRPSDGS